MESFFNSLDPDFKNERLKIAQVILEKNPELAHYLFNEWKLWISKVNVYRTNTIHKYIPNRLYFTSTVIWSSVDTVNNPREPQISPIKNTKTNIEMDKHVNESHSNLTKFLSKTSELLNWYEPPHEDGKTQILSGLESEKQTTIK